MSLKLFSYCLFWFDEDSSLELISELLLISRGSGESLSLSTLSIEPSFSSTMSSSCDFLSDIVTLWSRGLTVITGFGAMLFNGWIYELLSLLLTAPNIYPTYPIKPSLVSLLHPSGFLSYANLLLSLKFSWSWSFLLKDVEKGRAYGTLSERRSRLFWIADKSGIIGKLNCISSDSCLKMSCSIILVHFRCSLLILLLYRLWAMEWRDSIVNFEACLKTRGRSFILCSSVWMVLVGPLDGNISDSSSNVLLILRKSSLVSRSPLV